MEPLTTSAHTWWPSPAKINLFLHVLGRQDNGYHRLQTLFQLLDYGDALAFELTDTPDIVMATPLPGVADDDNLIVRAARALQAYGTCSQGARIYLNKRLPMGGGIGGGSSNAATTLVVLNHLWGCHLSNEALATIGLTLGADVPVFVHGRTAFADGVGEQLVNHDVPETYYLVAHPGVHVSTQAVFNHPQLPRNTPPLLWQDYNFESTHNDCEEIVCQQYPEVANLLQWLVHYAPARMTGTGSGVFACFASAEAAQTALVALPKNWSGFVARGVNLSPLHEKLSAVTPIRK